MTFKFDTVRSVLEKERREEDANEFVSAVCWRPVSYQAWQPKGFVVIRDGILGVSSSMIPLTDWVHLAFRNIEVNGFRVGVWQPLSWQKIVCLKYLRIPFCHIHEYEQAIDFSLTVTPWPMGLIMQSFNMGCWAFWNYPSNTVV